MKRSISILCALAFVAAMASGCNKKDAAEPKKAEPAVKKAEPTAKKAEPKKEEPKKEEAKKDEGEAVGKIGIKECDDFLTKYIACIKGKVPEASRAQVKKGVEMMAAAWKKQAATVDKAMMAKQCAAAHTAAKQTMAAYKCEW